MRLEDIFVMITYIVMLPCVVQQYFKFDIHPTHRSLSVDWWTTRHVLYFILPCILFRHSDIYTYTEVTCTLERSTSYARGLLANPVQGLIKLTIVIDARLISRTARRAAVESSLLWTVTHRPTHPADLVWLPHDVQCEAIRHGEPSVDSRPDRTD